MDDSREENNGQHKLGRHSKMSHLLVPFEELHGSLVFLRGRARFERAEIAPLPGLRVLLPGIQAILAGLQLTNHRALFVGVSVTRIPTRLFVQSAFGAALSG
jgi:hypothetical protein